LSPAIPLACLAGEPWVLGTPGAPVNQMLKDIIDQSATANGRQALSVIRAKMAAIVGDGGIKQREPEMDPKLSAKAKTIADIDTANITAIRYNDFVKEGRQAGLSMPEISKAWSDHKAHVAGELAVAS
jgi:hypothetical protein